MADEAKDVSVVFYGDSAADPQGTHAFFEQERAKLSMGLDRPPDILLPPRIVLTTRPHTELATTATDESIAEELSKHPEYARLFAIAGDHRNTDEEQRQKTRRSGEFSSALGNLGAYLQHELEYYFPGDPEMKEISTHIHAIFTGESDNGYTGSVAKRKREKKIIINGITNENDTYDATVPGALETACLFITNVAQEPLWGTDLSCSMMKIVNTLLFRYRLSGVNAEYLDEMPDLKEQLIKAAEQFGGVGGARLSLRREAYSGLDQLPITPKDAERIIWTMDKDEYDLSHPFAFRATAMLMEQADSPWVAEQKSRQEKLTRLMAAHTPQQLFDNYDVLSGLAQRIVLLQSDREASGKIGMELEYKQRKGSVYKLHKDWIAGDGGANMEIRRSDSALSFNRSYVQSLLPLSHWMRDNADSFAGFHFHLDKVAHPVRPDLGNLLTGRGNGDEVLSIRDNKLNTWEVRSGFPPSVSWLQNQPDPAAIAHMVNLHIRAAASPAFSHEFPRISMNEKNSSFELHQLIFGHIIRHTNDPNARIDALMALKHPLLMNSVSVVSLSENFDPAVREELLKHLFFEQIRSDEKPVCLVELYKNHEQLTETDAAFLKDILRSRHNINVQAVLDFIYVREDAAVLFQDELFELLKGTEKRRQELMAITPNEKNSNKKAMLLFEQKQLVHTRGKLELILARMNERGTLDLGQLGIQLLDDSVSIATANMIHSWKFPKEFLRTIIPGLFHNNSKVFDSVWSILHGKTLQPDSLRLLIDGLGRDERHTENIRGLLSENELPPDLVETLVLRTAKSEREFVRATALKALAGSTLTDEQQMLMISYLDELDTDLTQGIVSLFKNKKLSDAVFNAFVGSASRILNVYGHFLLDAYIAAFDGNLEGNAKRQMALVSLLSGGSMDLSYVAYKACRSAGRLDESVIKKLSEMVMTMDKEHIPFVTWLLAGNSATDAGKVPDYIDVLFRSGNSDVIISLLSAYAVENKVVNRSLYAYLARLMTYPDLRVRLAVIRLASDDAFAKFIDPEAYFRLLAELKTSATGESVSPTVERVVSQLKKKDALAAAAAIKASAGEMPEEERMLSFRGPYEEVFGSQFQELYASGKFRSVEAKFGKRYRLPNQFYLAMQSGERPHPQRSYTLVNAEMSIPPVVGSALVIKEIYARLKAYTAISDARVMELLETYAAHPDKEMRDTIRTIVSKQKRLSAGAIDRVLAIAASGPDEAEAWIQLLCNTGRSGKTFHGKLFRLAERSSVAIQRDIISYLSRRSQIPKWAVRSLKKYTTHEDTRLASLAFATLLSQRTGDRRLLSRVVRFCNNSAVSESDRNRAFEALKYQHDLPEQIMLWVIPAEKDIGFRTVQNVCGIVDNQKLLSPAAYRAVYAAAMNPAIESYNQDRLLDSLAHRAHLPQTLVETMIGELDSGTTHARVSGFLLRILMVQEQVTERALLRIFSHADQMFEGDYADAIRNLAPKMQHSGIAMRCLGRFINQTQYDMRAVYAALGRFDAYPRSFLDECLSQMPAYDNKQKAALLKFLSKQRGLPDALLRKISELDIGPEQNEMYGTKKYILWRNSKNPYKAVVAKIRRPEWFIPK